VTYIAITRIQQEGSLIIQDSLAGLIVSKIGVAQIEIKLRRLFVFIESLCNKPLI